MEITTTDAAAMPQRVAQELADLLAMIITGPQQITE